MSKQLLEIKHYYDFHESDFTEMDIGRKKEVAFEFQVW